MATGGMCKTKMLTCSTSHTAIEWLVLIKQRKTTDAEHSETVGANASREQVSVSAAHSEQLYPTVILVIVLK